MDQIIHVGLETAGKAMMNEVKILSEVKEKVEEMKRRLPFIQSFLEDADHHVSSHSEQRKSRGFLEQISQLREACLDEEDIIDSYMVELELRKRRGVMNLIKRYACIAKHGRYIHVIGSKIDAVNSRLLNLRMTLETLGGAEVRFGAAGSSSTPGGRSKPWQSRSYPHIRDRNVVGLDLHVDKVVGMLLGGEENEPCTVVSIYGMGGLGKTTLANKVYGDERVRKQFEKFAWVYVSQQFNERDVWESTLAQLTSNERKGISELEDEQLFANLSRVLRDHKCLVVLDDVWSIQDWEKLHVGLQLEETSTSKILFTTRKPIVAEHANRKGTYGGLKPLSNKKSFELLRKIALEGRDHEIADQKSIEDLANGMLEHCGGLPLAIIVLGGILATKDSLREWQIVHDNVNAYLRRGKGHDEEQGLGVHQVLAYSYYDLPLQLKNCFLYLSQFPEDYEIHTNTLMKMWMAEGFVSVEGEETIEDVAERYLSELVGRCVVEIGKTGSTGRIRTCRLHDVMREMCLLIAKEENLIHNIQRKEARNAAPKGKIRRLSMFGDVGEEVSLSSYYQTSFQIMRSLMVSNTYEYGFPILILAPVRLADGFKLLRMLLLEGIDIGRKKDVSKKIGKLILLKYLSLRNSWIYDFPLMDKLGCMETLDLRFTWVKKKICPRKVREIWKMKHLRHLYLPSNGDRYSRFGENVQIDEAKPNVQTLVNFPPPKCDVGGILNFPNLRKLMIYQGKHMLKFWEILNKNSGFSFTRLHSFSLTRTLYDVNVDIEVLFKLCPHLYKLNVEGPIEKFPQVNQFPNKLTKLILRYSRIQDPEHIETTLGNLPNLRILEMSTNAFSGEQLSFKKGTFLQLKSLKLQLLIELNSWTVEQGAMPILESLMIVGLRKLGTIPEGLGSIATLNTLKISHMPTQFAERLKEGGADFDRVKNVPSIIFTNAIGSGLLSSPSSDEVETEEAVSLSGAEEEGGGGMVL